MFDIARKRHTSSYGLTLIELLVTITVITLVAAIAIPVFSNILQSTQATADADKSAIATKFVTDWTSADAIVRPGTGSDTGYLVAFRDLNDDGIMNNGETPLAKLKGSLPGTLGIPTALTAATISSTSVRLSWAAPGNPTTHPITGYTVRYSTNPDFSSSSTQTTSTTPTATISGLTAGTEYYFEVAAVTSDATSAYSTPASSLPFTTPGAPTSLTATPTGTTTVALTWTAPVSRGGQLITSYRLTTSTTSDFVTAVTVIDTASNATTTTLTGLTAGTTYYVKVAATNASGTGAPSAPAFAQTDAPVAPHEVISATAPTAPTALTLAVASGTSMTASWSAPASDGGDPVTGYRVTYSTSPSFSTGNTTIEATTTTATITGLTPGITYYVRVAAVNGIGTGTESTTASKATATAPAAPAAPLATLTGTTTASLDWSAPAANGSPITRYAVTSSPAGPSITVSGTAATITSLSTGTDYTFTVTATNAEGTSPASAASNTITAASTPGAPTGVTLTVASSSSLTADWSAPTADGGDAISSYRVTYATSSTFTTGVQIIDTGSTATTATLTSLTPGAVYYVKIAATNNVGTGTPSSSASATPAAAPNAPSAPTATLTTVSTASLDWTAPASNGSTITSYTVTTTPSGPTAAVTGTSATITGLASGTDYTFTVRATNAIGTSSSSLASNTITSAALPGTPTGLSLSIASSTSLTATWTAPATDGGDSISSYRVTYSTAADFASSVQVIDTGSTATTKTITGLTPGTLYYVKVAATNGVGTGTASAAGIKAPAAAPSAPAAPTATLTGLTTASLAWTAPAANGSAITGYTITSSPAGAASVITGTTATISGLTAGTDYTFTVRAANAQGTSASSPASNTITSATVPGAPTRLAVANASSTSLTASWTAPASTGGDTITGYRVTYSTASDFSTGTNVLDTGLTATSKTLTGLTPGTLYYVKVAATNGVGTGTASSAASATPSAAPDAPTNVSVTVASESSLTVSWTTPATNGLPISGYTVMYSTTSDFASSTGFSTGSLTPQMTLTGLTPGTLYYVKVRASSPGFTGVYSAASSATPAAAPGTPTALTITPALTTLSATWTAPAATNGSAITSYRVTYSTSADFSTGTNVIDTGVATASAQILSLTSGTTYYVKVAATNAIGTGTATASTTTATATPITLAYASSSFAAGSTNATISPSTTGGTGTKTYSYTGTLPAGVTFDTATGVFTGPGGATWQTGFVSAGGTSTDLSKSVAFDSSGNAVILGTFTNSITFGSTTLTAPGGATGTQLFVAKLSPAGTWLWAAKGGATGAGAFNTAGAIALDSSDNAFIATSTTGAAVFGSTNLPGKGGGFDIVVAKMSSSGSWLWAVQSGSAYVDGATGIAVDSSGNAVVTGYLTSGVFGGTTLNAVGGTATDIFAAKISSAGSWLWAKSAGGSVADHGNAVTVNSNGDVFVAGDLNAGGTFGTITVTSYGTADVFVAKMDGATGTWLWVAKAGGTGTDTPAGIAMASNGDVLVTGSYTNAATFGSTAFTSTTSQDIFVAKVAAVDGTWVWATKAGSTSSDSGYGIAGASDGSVYVTGAFAGTASFGAVNLTAGSGGDLFVGKLSSSGTWSWAKSAGALNVSDNGYGIALDAYGMPLVVGTYGSPTYSATFGSATQLSNGGADAFAVKLGTDGTWQGSGGFPSAITVTVTDSTGSASKAITLSVG